MGENRKGSFIESLKVDPTDANQDRRKPGMGQIAARVGLALALTLPGCGNPNYVKPISEGGGPSNGHTTQRTNGYEGSSYEEITDKVLEQDNIRKALTHLIAQTAGIPEVEERTKVIYKIDQQTHRPRIEVTTDNGYATYVSKIEWDEYEKKEDTEEMMNKGIYPFPYELMEAYDIVFSREPLALPDNKYLSAIEAMKGAKLINSKDGSLGELSYVKDDTIRIHDNNTGQDVTAQMHWTGKDNEQEL